MKRDGVPGLGSIPWFSALFSNKEATSRSSETVALITPRVIRNPNETVSPVERNTRQQSEQMFLRMGTELGSLLPLPGANASTGKPAETEKP